MKKLNKKGFTIVELVIVIAVIAILAAVLIPTFSGVVEKANTSARLQKARNAFVEWSAESSANAEKTDKVIGVIIKESDTTNYYFTVTSGTVKATTTAVTHKTVGDIIIEINANGQITGNESTATNTGNS